MHVDRTKCRTDSAGLELGCSVDVAGSLPTRTTSAPFNSALTYRRCLSPLIEGRLCPKSVSGSFGRITSHRKLAAWRMFSWSVLTRMR